MVDIVRIVGIHRGDNKRDLELCDVHYWPFFRSFHLAQNSLRTLGHFVSAF